MVNVLQGACNIAKLRNDNCVKIEDLHYSAGIFILFLLETQFGIHVPDESRQSKINKASI